MDQYRLRERRLALGLTQCQIAARIGVRHQATISVAEQGGGPLHIRRKIVRAFILELCRRRCERQTAARVARNETLLDAIPPSPEREAFRAALLERVAIYIFEEAEPEKGDALLEFVSERNACSLLDELFPD